MKRALLLTSILFTANFAFAAEPVMPFPPALPGAVEEVAALEQQADNFGPEVYDFPELNVPVLPKVASSPDAPAPSSSRADEAAPSQMRLKAESVKNVALKTLSSKGAGDEIKIEGMRFDHHFSGFSIPTDISQLTVQDVQFDTKSGKFSGRVTAPGQNTVQFRGKYYTHHQVPVLARRMQNGEIITAADITMVSMPSKRLLSSRYIADTETMIGKTLKRNIAANRPLRRQDISLPVAVEKDKQVTMIFRSGTMQLTDLGLSMDKGSVGDVVRVKNLKSGQMIRARIEAPDMVLVNYMEQKPTQTAALGGVNELQP